MVEKSTPANLQFLKNAEKSVVRFAKFIKYTGENTDELIRLSKTIKDIFNKSANQINEAVKQFRIKIGENEFEHQMLQHYFDDIGKSFHKISAFNLEFSLLIQNTFVEPLETFHKSSYNHNIQLYKSMKGLVGHINYSHNKMEIKKKDYYQLSLNAEKSQERLEKILDKLDSGNFSKMELERESDKTTKMKLFAEEAKLSYEESVGELNHNLNEFKLNFMKNFAIFDLKEENRIDLIRRKGQEMIELISSHYSKGIEMPKVSFLIKGLKDKLKKHMELPTKITELVFNQQDDLSELTKERKEKIISYDQHKIEEQQNKLDERFYVVDLDDVKKDEIQDLKLLVALIFGLDTKKFLKKIKPELKDNLVIKGRINIDRIDYIFSKKPIRELFIKETLRMIPQSIKKRKIEFKKINLLETALHSVIRRTLLSVERDAQNFLNLLKVLHGFYSTDGEKTVYLYQPFGKSSIWNDTMLWKDSFELVVKSKKEDLEDSIRSQRGGGLLSTPWKLVSGIKHFIIKRNPKEEKRVQSKIKHESLEVIKYFLSNLNLSLGYSTEILMTIAKEYRIAPNILASQIDSLENNFHTKDMIKYVKNRKSILAQMDKWGKLLAFRLAMDYLEDPKDLVQILCVSKKWNSKFKNHIIKKVLTRKQDFSNQSRLNLWQIILDIKNCPKTYLGTDAEKIKLSEDLEDVITMDVKRSFPNHKDFKPKILKRILRSIAFTYQDSASYCQGMNYVAGVFLFLSQEEETSFRMMSQLLEKRMMRIFTNNFTYLQMNFFTLDRLIHLYIPALGEHFKHEGITPVFYSSGWFITMFSNTFQYTRKSFLALWVFDFYMSEGNRGLLKCLIVLLRHLSKSFLKISFDKIMNYLSEITKKELFTNIEYKKYVEAKENGMTQEQLIKLYDQYKATFDFLDSFRIKVKKISLNSNLLHHLEGKYKIISRKLKKKL